MANTTLYQGLFVYYTKMERMQNSFHLFYIEVLMTII